LDANGTHYHLLLGYDDWAGCSDADARATLRDAWERELSPPDDAATPQEGGETALAWDSARNELTLQPELFNFIAAEGDAAPDLERRRGGARDRFGNWYWIDDTRKRLLVNSAGTKLTTPFWPVEGSAACAHEPRAGAFEPKDPAHAPAPQAFGGLAVTEDHYLVVGTVGPAGLLVFDLHAGGAPRQMLWPAGVGFTPFDMAARPGGGVWILDRARKRYWALDRHFNVTSLGGDAELTAEPEVFKPRAGGAPPQPGRAQGGRRPARITDAMAAALDVDDPISIEALPDCSVLVLSLRPGWPFSRIHRYLGAREFGRPVSTIAIIRLIDRELLRTFRLVGHDFAFVAGHEGAHGAVPDRLYIVESAGNQAFAFDLTWRPAQEVEDPARDRIRLDPVAEFLPLRLFGGKGLVAAGASVYYDFGDGWIPLAEQRRPRYATAAALVTRPFDGREPDCVWHRMLLDACVPPETSVRVETRTANDLAELAGAAWLPEPRPYMRGDGSELPFVRRESAAGTQANANGAAAGAAAADASRSLADKARKAGRGTWELLFQRARGRYLQIKLELLGNQRTTPRLRALRAYYPRFSYLDKYLPAVYREDGQSASFLDRFLANFEGLYTALESKIAAAQMLFDVRSAPPDVLEWLASWFGVALDPAWDEARRRLFIKYAMLFFQYRGTMRGLEMALSLVLDDCVDESVFTDGTSARRRQLRGVRLTEKFRTRPAQQSLTTAATAQGPRLLTEAQVKTPLAKTIAGVQQQRLSATLHEFALPAQGGAFLPLGSASLNRSASWRAAAQAQLGFVPAAGDEDRGAWQDFLARRYQRVGALNAAYQTDWKSFAAVPLPSELPPAGPALQDWYDFETVVIAMRRTAHRFTVLLPVRRAEAADADAQQQRRALTERIVNLEKPAHTIFDVKFYWAMFRVGEARLGSDTLIDLGSRAPELTPPMVLDREHLAEAYLAAGHPQDVRERFVVGREQRSGSI
jgi:phage tail-like protein